MANGKEEKSFFPTGTTQTKEEMNDSIKVINLSSKTLTEHEINLLEKGSKFTPSPSPNTHELKKDLNEFNRKLRLREFFYPDDNEDSDDNDQSDDGDEAFQPLKNKSKFTPPRQRDKHLDTFVDFISNYPLHSEKGKISNVSKEERNVINSLANDDSIVIKQADKGGAFVIMDKQFYIDKMNVHTEDSSTYKTIPSNNDTKIMNKIKKLTDKYHHNLTDQEIDYLLNFETKTSNLYGLPKIHKNESIKNQIHNSSSSTIQCDAPIDLKMRPIIAGPQCPTHRLSNFVDILLKPLIHQVQSFVRDDLDFLNHLPERVDDDAFLITFDVVSLYTNIPHESGIAAISYWLNHNRSGIPDRFDNDFIIDAIKLILENNSFHFNDNFFTQIKGTAMGTKMASSYATLFMGFLELSLYEDITKQFNANISSYFKKNWLRYLDDCFIIWPKHFGNPAILTTILNNLHPNITFTTNINNKQIPFLDIMVEITNKEIHTDIYYKPTDTHQYLHFKSCHPRHTKTNIPYNLARRICTIVSSKDKQKQRLNDLKNMLISRSYPLTLIESGIAKAQALNKDDLLKPQNKNNDKNILTFVHTYNPNNKEMCSVINNSLKILQGSNKLQNMLNNTKIIMSKRQAPNLKKLLTKAKINNTLSKPTVSKCQNKRCGTCAHILEGSEIKFKAQTKPFTIKQNMSCTSKNIIYVITCNGCNEQYIGHTSDLRKRVTVHKQQIKDSNLRKLPISKHIHSCAKHKTPQFSICPFYKMNTDDTPTRLIKESYFIQKFKPTLNKSL